MAAPTPPPTIRAWDATGPLEPGLTVLEASAGTGKTWQISSLVTRLVAEDAIPIDQLLVVTFTRAATAELVDRVRARLAETLVACGAEAPPKDPVLAHLWRRAQADTHLPIRLRIALENFDQASINTIHGFCQRMLSQHAFESGTPPDLELLEDASELVDEVVADRLALARHDAGPGWARFLETECGLSPKGYEALGKAAQRGDLRVVPQLADDDPTDALTALDLPDEEDQRLDLAARVRAGELRWLQRTLEARAEARGVLTFDDLLRRLARGLDPAHTPDAARREALRAAIRGRYTVALIDEFQDTDQVQWQVFREVFLSRADEGSRHALYLIGDPKQSIYGFRGANIQVYLDAVRHPAARLFALDTNFRSDAPLVGALNALWGDAEATLAAGAFLEPGIRYAPVAANKTVRLALADSAPRPATRPPAGPDADLVQPGDLEHARHPAPLQIRWFDSALEGDPRDPLTPLDEAEAMGMTGLRARVAERAADDVVALLEAGWRRVAPEDEARPKAGDRNQTDAGTDGEPLHPGDIAILVRANQQARDLLGALRAVGVPAVILGGDSVLDTPERDFLLSWMAAVANPGDDYAARRLAVEPAFGFVAADLIGLDAELPAAVARWDAWLSHLREAALRFEQRGLMAALRPMLDAYDALARLLPLPGGERAVTNLLHLAELCHAAWQRDRLGLGGLQQWLAQAAEGDGPGREALEQRLESDAAAVRILTMHKSKGLQFPVVLLPYLWDAHRDHLDNGAPLTAPHPDDGAALRLDVHPPGHPARAVQRAAADEVAARENLRLAYVALTRAEHRCLIYWGPVTSNRKAAHPRASLALLLHPPAADASEAIDPAEPPTVRTLEAPLGDLPTAELHADLAARLTRLDPAGQHLNLSRCAPPTGARWRPPPVLGPLPPLGVRPYTRGPFDPRWRVHSYTSLTRGRHATTDPDTFWADYDQHDPDAPELGADPDASTSLALGAAPPTARPLVAPMAEFAAGAEAGIFLHKVLEVVDFTGTAEARRAALTEALAQQAPRYGFAPQRVGAALTEGLACALETPLGGPLGAVCLADIARADRLDELRFHLALGGADASRWSPTPESNPDAAAPGHLADLPLRACFETPDDRARPQRARADGLPRAYVEALGELRFGAIAGYLTGAIDLVFRHAGRWYLADYKSNKLHAAGAVPTEVDYGPRALALTMASHHYYLQGYLYAVALHRHLRRRLPGYQPEAHLGGISYLFLRGMTGALAPPADARGRTVGCVTFRPDLRVVAALDALLAGAPLPTAPDPGPTPPAALGGVR